MMDTRTENMCMEIAEMKRWYEERRRATGHIPAHLCYEYTGHMWLEDWSDVDDTRYPPVMTEAALGL